LALQKTRCTAPTTSKRRLTRDPNRRNRELTTSILRPHKHHPQPYLPLSSFPIFPSSPPTHTLTLHPVESCPPGYPHLAAFLSSDENFSLYRRFSYLSARLLLHKQDTLRALEAKLDALDRRDDTNEEGRRGLRCRDLDDAGGARRGKLFGEIEGVFKAYGE
jgi:hypothetical protein